MTAPNSPTFLRVAVVLDDPAADVSTDGLLAVVTAGGEVAIGPASAIGDVAEWVFDAAADSFEAAYDLVLGAVLRHIGAGHGVPGDTPGGATVHVWAEGGVPPAAYSTWWAARRDDLG